MTRRRWALLAWGGFLAILIGAAAIDGGRDCQVPENGPFHWLLNGRKYVRSYSLRFACTEVSPQSADRPKP